MHKKYFFSFYLILILLISCHEEDPAESIPQPSLYLYDTSFHEIDEDYTTIAMVHLSHESTKEITVLLHLTDSTAVGGNDFTSEDQVITIKPGYIEGSIFIEILEDGQQEEEEFFKMSLTDPINATIEKGEANARITDDD